MAVRRMARLLLPLAWATSFCHRMAVCRLAHVLLPLAWVNSSLLSYGRTPYDASIIAFGLWVTSCLPLYSGTSVLLPLAWVN